jgi:DNA-binding GntR family transcriptional regulator
MSTLTSKVRLASLVETLVERLETAIIAGELAAGERLREARLAAQLGVGRGVLREAVRQLEGRRMLVRIPNRGSRVADPSPRELQELLVIREALEATACRLAAQHITPAELTALRAAVQVRLRAREQGKLIEAYRASLESDFHYLIARASRNERLLELLYGDLFYFMRLHRYRATTAPGRSAVARGEHEAIIAALASHDPDAAEAAMRLHLQRSHATILGLLQPDAEIGTGSRP